MLSTPPPDFRPPYVTAAPSTPQLPAVDGDVDRLLTAACGLAGALCDVGAGACDPAPLAAVAGALGRGAARAGLTPDELLARIEDGVHEQLVGRPWARPADGRPTVPAHAADAAVLAVWGASRDAYHDTRAALDAAARAAARAARQPAPPPNAERASA